MCISLAPPLLTEHCVCKLGMLVIPDCAGRQESQSKVEASLVCVLSIRPPSLYCHETAIQKANKYQPTKQNQTQK